MTYPAPPHIVRSLSPITELTTPASARSIPLPPVNQAYDYKDESPIRPTTSPHRTINGDREEEADGEGGEDDDGASTYSAESARTVVPTSAEPSPIVVSPARSQDTALPSPPLTVRPFLSPTASLPPPPRNVSAVRSSTPQLSTQQLDHEPSELPYDHSPLEPSPRDHHSEDDDEVDRASVSTAGMAGIGTGRWEDAIREKKARPKSLHSSRPPPSSPIASAMPSRHASLINIASLPANVESPINLNDAVSKLAESKTSPIALDRPKPSSPKSRPSSPKSRPSTLKKRPNSYHTPRPASWHSQKSIRSPKKNDKGKGKVKGKVLEVEGSGSSNDDQSDTIKSPPMANRATSTSPRKRIPSILLSLFDPVSARQSRAASLVSSPTGSDHPHTPNSPPTPSLNTLDDPEWTAIQPAPQEAIRTSGTFGIRDDGSVHLLRNDDEGPAMPRTSTSSRPDRARRDSDNGTLKSAGLDRVLYAVNHRESLDQSEETEHQHQRSLTPFQLENPTSPLESVLNGGRTSDELTRPERKSVDAPHNLLLTARPSDTSQRAQSPSTEQAFGVSTSTVNVSTQYSSAASHIVMVDRSIQTSGPPSPIYRRPLPRPPASSTHSKHAGPASSHRSHVPAKARGRPQSLPPAPTSATGPSPTVPHGQSDGRAPKLPMLIVSHLLSTHAAALMRQSTGLIEGAEALKRMADESMQWGSMLLSMASKADQSIQPISAWPKAPRAPGDHTYNDHSDSAPAAEMLDLPTGTPHRMLYPSTPVFHPPPTSYSMPERDTYRHSLQAQIPEPPGTLIESDCYTRLPPRTSRISRNSRRQSNARESWTPRSPLRDVEQERYDGLPPRHSMSAPMIDGVPTERDQSHRIPPQPRSAVTAPLANGISTGFYRDVDHIGRRGWDELHKAEEVWTEGMQGLRSFLDAGPDTASSENHTNENECRRSSSDHHQHQHQQREEVLDRPHRTSYSSDRRTRASLRRGASNVSAVRTDESFLPQTGDLRDPSSGTRTDESFLPQSADLITPIDDNNATGPGRPRPPSATVMRTRPTLSPALSTLTADSAIKRKGYEPAQIHTLLQDDPNEAFGSPPPPPSAVSSSTMGRKLRKRASMASDKLRQASSGGESTIKVKGKKRHWWSRPSRVSGSDDLHEPHTAI